MGRRKKAKAKENVSKPKAPAQPDKQYTYTCQACSQVAIETSNKMLGIMIDCMACGKRIKLEDEARYRKFATKIK